MDRMKNSIPKGANPGGRSLQKVDLADKYLRGVGFGPRAGDFKLVCKFGADQLIQCYGYHGFKGYEDSVYDVAIRCQDCPYCTLKMNFSPDDLYRTNGYPCNWWSQAPERVSEELAEYVDNRENARWKVYFISDGHFAKIGKSNDVRHRLAELQCGNGNTLRVLFTIGAKSERAAYRIENTLHYKFKMYRMEGEWFDILHRIDISKWQEVFSKA